MTTKPSVSPLATMRRSRLAWARAAKAAVPPIVWNALYRRLVVGDIPSRGCYQPHYAPWLEAEFAARFQAWRGRTEVSAANAWTLWTTAAQALNAPGEVMEAGVFRGGTARLLKEVMAGAGHRRLLLFDSFAGMRRVSDGMDRHQPGDFSDTSLESVREFVGNEPSVEYHQGWIPESFAGLEHRQFCFAHIDLDLRESIADCLEFLWPRLSPGGAVVFDDYGLASCPGARRAVDEFFAGKPERPLALMTGQALVLKL